MRSKVLIAILWVAVTVLLATNPVVADAAKQITGGQIKNNSVTGKDVKTRSLTGKDLKRNAVADEIKAFERFAGGTTPVDIPTLIDPAFFGPTSVVKVDKNDVLLASASTQVLAAATGNDLSFGLCSQRLGNAGEPTALGGPAGVFEDIDLLAGENALTSDGSAVLPAGKHRIGWCARTIEGPISFLQVTGWVQVLDGGTGPLG